MAEPIKYLDYNGLSHFWNKIKSYVDNNSGGVSEIAWDNSSNMNNYKTKGIYFISGVHSNSGDNMPTTAYANGNIGAFLIITESTLDTTLQEKIIGQKLVLSNKVSSESKEYIRSCKIKNSQETWSPWKETNNILLFGDKSSGVASRSDIDNAIDNGQYMGIYITQDGFMPAGSTFTMTVINNYAANSSTGNPNNRQVTQIFIYTPLSTNGEINESVMCKRDGIGGDSITWGDMMPIGVGKKTAEGGEIFNNISGDNANTAAFKAHAEGQNTTASGYYSHAEGIGTTASGEASHAEGGSTTASGTDAHAEGINTKASGLYSHAEGSNTNALGDRSHAEGDGTTASGNSSHTEGWGTIAYRDGEHAEGVYNKSYDSSATNTRVIHSVGIGSSSSSRKNAHEIKFNGDHYVYGIGGYDGTNSGTADTLQEVINEKPGKKVSTSSNSGEIFNDYNNNVASGQYSHAEGQDTNALGNYGSHAEGYQTQAGDSSSDYSPHAEGYQTKATGDYGAHSEGKGTTASGNSSHAEGGYTIASGNSSHSEGGYTIASGYCSHAEGQETRATEQASHAEGAFSYASGSASHAEGRSNAAIGPYSHAGGEFSVSLGVASYVCGGGGLLAGQVYTTTNTVYNVTLTATGFSSSTNIDTGYWYYHSSKDKWYAFYVHEKTGNGPYTYKIYGSGDGLTSGTNTLYKITSSNRAGGAYNFVSGYGNIADGTHQFICGKFNNPNSQNYLMVGNGSNPTSRSNAFSVSGSGVVKAAGTITGSTTADYAEMFEWNDGNMNKEDRTGYFVSLVSDKIEISTSNSKNILGVISATPTILGDNPMTWHNRYLTDEWGRILQEKKEIVNEETGETFIEFNLKENPEWDSKLEYIERVDRPEWAAVGLMGKIRVRQDGTLKVGGYCMPNNNGIATISDNGYYVLKIYSNDIALILFR